MLLKGKDGKSFHYHPMAHNVFFMIIQQDMQITSILRGYKVERYVWNLW